jgi:DnaJ like chaperone protein
MSIWGKLLGAATGLALGGPIGALLGGVAGHVYDQWQGDRRDEPRALPPGPDPVFADPLETRRIAFATGVIVLAAKLAKADGVVTRDEVRAFKRTFAVSDDDVGSVARLFDEAKRDAGGFEPFARQLAELFAHDPVILEELLEALFAVAAADGRINADELRFLQTVARIFALDGLTFDAVRARFDARRGPTRAAPADPYAVLGLRRDASDDEIRTAYRRLVRELHPDRLIAKGVPEEFVRDANARLAAINVAHDTIEKERVGR